MKHFISHPHLVHHIQDIAADQPYLRSAWAALRLRNVGLGC